MLAQKEKAAGAELRHECRGLSEIWCAAFCWLCSLFCSFRVSRSSTLLFCRLTFWRRAGKIAGLFAAAPETLVSDNSVKIGDVGTRAAKPRMSHIPLAQAAPETRAHLRATLVDDTKKRLEIFEIPEKKMETLKKSVKSTMKVPCASSAFLEIKHETLVVLMKSPAKLAVNVTRRDAPCDGHLSRQLRANRPSGRDSRNLCEGHSWRGMKRLLAQRREFIVAGFSGLVSPRCAMGPMAARCAGVLAWRRYVADETPAAGACRPPVRA
jgi:hypothetical protein